MGAGDMKPCTDLNAVGDRSDSSMSNAAQKGDETGSN